MDIELQTKTIFNSFSPAIHYITNVVEVFFHNENQHF